MQPHSGLRSFHRLSFAVASCLFVAALSCPENASASVSKLRALFARHAAAIIESPFRFVPTAEDFTPDRSTDVHKLQLRLMQRGEDGFLLQWPDRQIRVREQGLSGRGALEGASVTYRRPGTTSFWTITEQGYEEWLLLDEGVATKSAPVATWLVEGATVESKGERVELLDETGSALVHITAPSAWAVDGRPVEVHLAVNGATIELWAAEEGSALLIDPLWMEGGSTLDAANGLPCSTGAECDSGFCVDGICCDTACNAGACDACTVATGATANGTCTLLTGPVCDDGNNCSRTDTCQNGVCVGANPVICSPTDQCHATGTCDPTTGFCSNPAKVDGSACNDGNACSQGETCQAGVCTNGSPVVCTPSNPCHTAGTCDPMTGFCSNPAKVDGAACNDGDACTQGEICQAGACTNGNPVTCPPPSQCHTAGTCNPANGTCSNPTEIDGAACNDGNACTQADSCQGGECVGAAPVICAPVDQYHDTGVCNPADGQCSVEAKADGAPCNDGDACTQSDGCQAGACVGSNEVSCSASDQCHEPGACDPQTGTCSNPSKIDGAACDDGDACTQVDVCEVGACQGHAAVECPAMGECLEAGTCVPPTGACSTGVPVQDGTPCTNGFCTGGTCVVSMSGEDGGTPVDAGHSVTPDAGSIGAPDAGVAATPAPTSGCDCHTAGSGLLPLLVLVGLSGVLRRQRARIE